MDEVNGQTWMTVNNLNWTMGGLDVDWTNQKVETLTIQVNTLNFCFLHNMFILIKRNLERALKARRKSLWLALHALCK